MPAIASDGTVYVGAGYCLYALSPDGMLKWRHETDGEAGCPAIATDGTICVGVGDYLYALSPDGVLKWRHQTGGLVRFPAIATDGTIYIGSDDGYLYAIQGTSPLADSPWPKFHHDNKNTGRVGGGR